jgi:hypothetical protein
MVVAIGQQWEDHNDKQDCEIIKIKKVMAVAINCNNKKTSTLNKTMRA